MNTITLNPQQAVVFKVPPQTQFQIPKVICTLQNDSHLERQKIQQLIDEKQTVGFQAQMRIPYGRIITLNFNLYHLVGAFKNQAMWIVEDDQNLYITQDDFVKYGFGQFELIIKGNHPNLLLKVIANTQPGTKYYYENY